MSPQVRSTIAAVMDDLQGTALEPSTLPVSVRVVLAAKLRQYTLDELDGL